MVTAFASVVNPLLFRMHPADILGTINCVVVLYLSPESELYTTITPRLTKQHFSEVYIRSTRLP